MCEAQLVSREQWVDIVRRRLGNNDFEVVKFKTNRLATTGGYLGEHFLAEVTVQPSNSKESESVLNFFIKTEPNSSRSQLVIVNETSSFTKEVQALSLLFVELRSALENDGKNMEWMGKCYYARPGLIVMEDLLVKQFRVFGLRDVLGYRHFAMTMKVVANMHSASLIYEETRPTQPYRIGTVYADVLKEAFFRHAPESPNHPGSQWLQSSINTLWFLVELIRGKGALLRMKMELASAMKLMYQLEEPSKRFRNVVCHGDLKRDNIMFRYENEKPVEVCLVDFQFVRYAPPANDLLCLLHLATTRAFRAQFQEQLLALYYEQLALNLKRHGLDPEKVLSWKEFQESCEYYKKLGVIITSCYSPATLLKEEDISHIFKSSDDFERFLRGDRSPEVGHGFKTDPFYRERIVEIIEEFIEECVEKKSFENV